MGYIMNAEINATQTPTIEKPRRKRRLWLKILLIILVLFSGIIIGAGGTAIAVGRTLRTVFEQPQRLPEIMTRNMQRRLRLTDEQADKVRAVLETRIANIREIMKETHPRLRAEIEAMHDEISTILDENQREKWEQRFRRFYRMLPSMEEKKENLGQEENDGN